MNESNVFFKGKKFTFSITTHIQILIHLIKSFEVTGKRIEEMENTRSPWHIINQNIKLMCRYVFRLGLRKGWIFLLAAEFSVIKASYHLIKNSAALRKVLAPRSKPGG